MNLNYLIKKVPPLTSRFGLILCFVVVAMLDFFTSNMNGFIHSLPYSNHVFDVWVLSAIYIILRAGYLVLGFYWLYSVAYYFRNDLQKARIKLAGLRHAGLELFCMLASLVLVYCFVIDPFQYDIDLWLAHNMNNNIAYTGSIPYLVFEMISCLVWLYMTVSILLTFLLWLSLRIIPLEAEAVE